jgi:hypothetical protein
MASFSQEPDKVLQNAASKGYSRVLFQQGKPVLDRELNLLGDLSNPQRIAEQYLGSGVPAGSDGFAITNLNVAGSDFTIGAGRCLVRGSEIVLAGNTTYKTQPHLDKVAAFPAGVLNVYLRVFPTAITEAEDPDLKNGNDVGFVTAIREKADWEVLVSVPAINQPDHFLLATINTAANTVTDRRRRDLTVSALRDELNTASGTGPKLSNRLDASRARDGTIKPNVITNQQLADNAVTATKIAANSVNEPAMANNSVSKRTIVNGSVAMTKLGLTPVFDGPVVVPASPGAGQVGEATVVLQTVDEHAFFLISVLQVTPRPPLPQPIGFLVNWMHRVLAVKGPGPGSPYSHQHQVLFQNSSASAITVNCRAFRIADS